MKEAVEVKARAQELRARKAELEEAMNAMNEEKVKIRIGEGNSQPSRKERRKNK